MVHRSRSLACLAPFFLLTVALLPSFSDEVSPDPTVPPVATSDPLPERPGIDGAQDATCQATFH